MSNGRSMVRSWYMSDVVIGDYWGQKAKSSGSARLVQVILGLRWMECREPDLGVKITTGIG
jgi:hypothetical protein